MRALILALLVSLPLAAPPSQSGENSSPRGDEASARAALQARFDAALRGDVPALDRLLADDLEYCGVSATCSTKAQYLESVRNGTRKFKSLVPRVERVTMYADSAVLTGKVYALSIG